MMLATHDSYKQLGASPQERCTMQVFVGMGRNKLRPTTHMFVEVDLHLIKANFRANIYLIKNKENKRNGLGIDPIL